LVYIGTVLLLIVRRTFSFHPVAHKRVQPGRDSNRETCLAADTRLSKSCEGDQCYGSVTYWNGSGSESSDLYHGLADTIPDSDPDHAPDPALVKLIESQYVMLTYPRIHITDLRIQIRIRIPLFSSLTYKMPKLPTKNNF